MLTRRRLFTALYIHSGSSKLNKQAANTGQPLNLRLQLLPRDRAKDIQPKNLMNDWSLLPGVRHAVLASSLESTTCQHTTDIAWPQRIPIELNARTEDCHSLAKGTERRCNQRGGQLSFHNQPFEITELDDLCKSLAHIQRSRIALIWAKI